MQKVSRIYVYKYFYALIMFLGFLILAFLLSTFESNYNEVVDEYNDAVKYAVSENFSDETKEHILDLYAKVEDAKILQRYSNFVSIMIIFIFLALFNFFYLKFGVKLKIINNTPSLALTRHLLLTASIIEIVYFLILVIFIDHDYIGINFWTLFFVNIIIMVFVAVLSLQIQYLLKPKAKESLE